MTIARWIFNTAAFYGLIVLIPGLFGEAQFGRDAPPPINHPEFYYGFYASALVWQFVFLLIARDPVRFRILMPFAVLEKAAFLVPTLWLYTQGRIGQTAPFYGALVDGVLMLLFAFAWLKTPRAD